MFQIMRAQNFLHDVRNWVDYSKEEHLRALGEKSTDARSENFFHVASVFNFVLFLYSPQLLETL